MMYKNPQAFIWLQTAFIGDIILTTAAMRLAKENFPRARQILITTGQGEDILKKHPDLDAIFVFDKKKGGVFQHFRKLKKQLSAFAEAHKLQKKDMLFLQVHKSHRSSLLAMYLGYPRIVYEESALSFLAKIRVNRVSTFHESIRIALVLEPLGVSREKMQKVRPFLDPLPLSVESPWQKAMLDLKPPVIAIAPGSMWGTKRWPVEYFSQLTADLLQKHPEASVVLLGSKLEKALSEKILEAVQDKARVLDLCGVTSLMDMRRIFPKLDLILSNDSSPIHFASAFNIPTVALFGATTPSLGFFPLADSSISLGIDALPCRPCSDHGPEVCPLGHFRCMKELLPSRVLEVCNAFIEKG